MNTHPIQPNPQLFAQLAAAFHTYPDHRGWIHIPCPECGKEPKKGQTHFSFNERFGKCQVCGYATSLDRLVQTTNVLMSSAPQHWLKKATVSPPKPRYWQSAPSIHLDEFLAHPNRLQRWTAYKPLDIDTISRWRLGVGVLPSSPCRHERLIYPLFVGTTIVGFRGRAITCDCAKWITAGGSTTILWGLDLVTPGTNVVIVENPVDAMLLQQMTPEIVGIASTAGAASWHDEWTAELAARQPKRVLIMLDHDLAGNGSRYHHGELVAAWRQKNPTAKRLPRPNGPRIATRLRAAGIPTALYVWPKGTPPKYDVGSLLAHALEDRT